MRRFLFDTNVWVYALGDPHPYRDSCRQLVASQGDGRLAGEITSMVVAELVHQRLRQTGDRREAAQRGRELVLACRVHAPGEADTSLALELYERVPGLDSFDSLLAATALNRGIDTILSADRAFDGVPDLERVDPLDAGALERLA